MSSPSNPIGLISGVAKDNIEWNHGCDKVESSILASAKRLIIERGVQGTSMAAIARDAGISRPTLYARYENRDAIVRQLLNNEIVGLLDAVFPIPTTLEDFINQIIQVAEKAIGSKFLKAIVSHDPEALVTYQYARLGRSQLTLIRFIKNIILKLQQDNNISQEKICKDDPEVLATFVLSTTQAVALQSTALEPHLAGRTTWKIELSKILKGYLSNV
ncbi:TetR family transcriptional regulator [Corynebacterium poyangense]|uniref:TetR family transcriptional regulator n=1 Tax=Corynebacterium poyangense TaxID=2684405 RepID=A0A7H0SL03_9CORY|nr:TetR/AcrR family transcriptional regulator [Corynebacterium poyangense]QNQ89228.1 TetR family transcriptional regulator [Corynebacterium poyangense]